MAVLDVHLISSENAKRDCRHHRSHLCKGQPLAYAFSEAYNAASWRWNDIHMRHVDVIQRNAAVVINLNRMCACRQRSQASLIV